MAIKEYKLQEIGKFQNYENVFSKYHVSTDNMEGHKMPNFYPKLGNYFPKNSILMSNIRPYFNKVWYSDREGSKSPNVLCFIVKNKNAISKYIYYLICGFKFNNFWSKTSKGTTMPVGDKNALLNYKFKLPDLDEQQQIINIIEPFEKLKLHLLKRKTLLIKLLDDLYLLNFSKNEKDILSFANLYNAKYKNQSLYIETSNIDENFSLINNLKTINENKKPCRANLTPKENSLIFGKLIGSKKLFPIYDKQYLNYVYSTGFYNISSNELDWYLFGFLNSNDFITQKNSNSSGTLMEGITINGLKKIKIKLPKINYCLNSILYLISKYNVIIEKIDSIISYLINIYIV